MSQLKCQQEHHDIVCIGLGSATMSLGIKLFERNSPPDIVFLESQPKVRWQPSTDMPGHVHMKSNFLNDLVTLENPRSRFTFIQFLKQRKLLVDFTNLSLMTPARELFQEYLTWCAKQFEQHTRFDTRVDAVEPVYSSNTKISGWSIFTENGSRKLYTAKKLLFFVGQEPWLPPILRESMCPSIVHSSHCLEALSKVSKPAHGRTKIGIIGQTQAAAELFNHLYDVRAEREIVWLVEEASFKVETQTALDASNPFFTPETKLPPELRVPKRRSAKPSSEPIDPALIASIYENQYYQSVKEADSTKWQYRVHFNQKLTNVQPGDDHRVRISHRDNATTSQQVQDFDLLIAATGFVRNSPHQLLSGLASKRLLEGSSLDVDAQYHLNFRRGLIEPDVGLWCIGTTGDAEIATGDDAFTLMAERSTRLAASLASRTQLSREATDRPIQAQL